MNEERRAAEKLDRVAEPPADMEPVSAVEITFGMPVYLSRAQRDALRDLVCAIVDQPCNQPANGVHWLFGTGAKPVFSARDAAFLGQGLSFCPGGQGHAGGVNALRETKDCPLCVQTRPADGEEPSFDTSILSFETASREFVSDQERTTTMARRAGRQS